MDGDFEAGSLSSFGYYMPLGGPFKEMNRFLVEATACIYGLVPLMIDPHDWSKCLFITRRYRRLLWKEFPDSDLVDFVEPKFLKMLCRL